MTEENKKQNMEEKKEDKKIDEAKPAKENKPEKAEEKKEDKPAEKKEEQAPKVSKKDEAVTRVNDAHASLKQSMYICNFIKGKSIEKAISDLEDVTKMKRAVPFKGEIPHRKGKIMSGRYPIKVSKIFITALKTLRGNIIANQMDLERCRITFASTSWAARPMKKGGRKFKRANIILKAKEVAN